MAIVPSRVEELSSNAPAGALPTPTTVPHAPVLSPAARESFRLLALNLRAILVSWPNKAVAVMSARSGDGRTTVATHLAMALADYNQTVLARSVGVEAARDVVPKVYSNGNGSSANSASPFTMHQWLRLRPDVETADLHTQHEVADLVGASCNDFPEVMEAASRAGIYSVVDTPPATSSSDAFLLASQVRQVLYVVRERRSQDMDIHREVRAHLARLGVGILGVVINDY